MIISLDTVAPAQYREAWLVVSILGSFVGFQRWRKWKRSTTTQSCLFSIESTAELKWWKEVADQMRTYQGNLKLKLCFLKSQSLASLWWHVKLKPRFSQQLAFPVLGWIFSAGSLLVLCELQNQWWYVLVSFPWK